MYGLWESRFDIEKGTSASSWDVGREQAEAAEKVVKWKRHCKSALTDPVKDR